MPNVNATVTIVREVCEWCQSEIQAGQNPPVMGICAECKKRDEKWNAAPECPNCGARKGKSVAGVSVKDGHRDSCITRAKSPMVTTHG